MFKREGISQVQDARMCVKLFIFKLARGFGAAQGQSHSSIPASALVAKSSPMKLFIEEVKLSTT